MGGWAGDGTGSVASVTGVNSSEPSETDRPFADGPFSAELNHWCDVIRAAVAACEWGARVPSSLVTNDSLCALASRVDANGFECFVREVPEHSLGIAIYLGGATLFNHSCDANCEMSHSMPRLTCKTIRPVPKGTALTVTYLNFPPKTPRSVRRRALKERYNFDCCCTRCEEERGNELPPAVAPHWLRWAHANGGHYMVAAALAGAGYWARAVLALVLYFFVWVHVCGYPI